MYDMNYNTLNQYVYQVMKDNYDSIIKYDSVADYFIEYIDTNDSLCDIANAAQIVQEQLMQKKDELKYFFAENYNAPVDFYINECDNDYEIIFYADDSCVKWCRDNEIFDDVSPDWFFVVLDENFYADEDFIQTPHYTFCKKGVFEKMVNIFKKIKQNKSC